MLREEFWSRIHRNNLELFKEEDILILIDEFAGYVNRYVLQALVRCRRAGLMLVKELPPILQVMKRNTSVGVRCLFYEAAMSIQRVALSQTSSTT